MDKHPPAPWTIAPLRSKYYGTEVRLGDKGSITVWLGGNEPSEREIAAGWEPDHGMDHVESTTDLAVARLIAAAPDLLAALEEVVSNAPSDAIWARAEAAIKKARGE